MAYLESYLPMVQQVAVFIARRYPPVEADDVAGELRLWLVENEHLLANYSNGYVYKCLRNAATSYCRKERSARLHLTDQYYYLVPEVRRLVEAYLLEALPSGDMSTQVWDGGMVFTVELSDLAIVWPRLNERYQKVLGAWVLVPPLEDGTTLNWERIGELTDETVEGAKKSVNRALRALVGLINRAIEPHEVTGRRVMSNAASRVATKKDYQGDR